MNAISSAKNTTVSMPLVDTVVSGRCKVQVVVNNGDILLDLQSSRYDTLGILRYYHSHGRMSLSAAARLRDSLTQAIAQAQHGDTGPSVWSEGTYQSVAVGDRRFRRTSVSMRRKMELEG